MLGRPRAVRAAVEERSQGNRQEASPTATLQAESPEFRSLTGMSVVMGVPSFGPLVSLRLTAERSWRAQQTMAKALYANGELPAQKMQTESSSTNREQACIFPILRLTI